MLTPTKMSQITPTPKSAYVHIPFCRHRCAYCNFTVVADRLDLETAYLDALERELESLEEPRSVETIYVGGGTPTELTDAGLERLCTLLDQWLPRSSGGIFDGCEYTFEANPEGLSERRLRRLAEFGVNRISLGVQSFDDDKLGRLDRQHSSRQSHQAIDLAKDAIDNVCIDLIFAAPGETVEEWKADIAAAMEHAPNHISTYGLTIESGTPFFAARMKGQLTEVAEGPQRSMYLSAIDGLTAAGFEHYEVSNFAQAGHHSRHNETYWLGQPYLAFGAGAARYLDGRRETNHRSTTTYIRRVLAGESPVAESEVLNDEERARERLVFGLRRLAGVRLSTFANDTGFTVDSDC